jgi:hypothetical protein
LEFVALFGVRRDSLGALVVVCSNSGNGGFRDAPTAVWPCIWIAVFCFITRCADNSAYQRNSSNGLECPHLGAIHHGLQIQDSLGQRHDPGDGMLSA